MPDKDKDDLTTQSTKDVKSEISVQSSNVRLPPFWPANPEVWFKCAESQFAVCKIKSDNDKFHHTVAILPPEVCESVFDIVASPPDTEKYTALKSGLIQRHALSIERRLDQLFEKAELGDKKPSEMYRQMKRMAGDTVSDLVIRTQWIRKLPKSISISLIAVGDKDVEDLSAIADRIYDATESIGVYNISNDNSSPGTSKQTQMDPTEIRLARLESMFADFSLRRSRSLNRGSNYKSNSYQNRSRSGSKNKRRSANRNSTCYYHRKFSDNARRCIQPCDWKSVSNNNNKSPN